MLGWMIREQTPLEATKTAGRHDQSQSEGTQHIKRKPNQLSRIKHVSLSAVLSRIGKQFY